MKARTHAQLEKTGWRIGSAADFLGITKEESAFIEMMTSPAETLRKRRLKKGLSQVELAQLIDSSQSRVAKMESGDSSVSMDLFVHTEQQVSRSSNER
jgi:ribosome-binding protein aMBF1 (putative translation factor)